MPAISPAALRMLVVDDNRDVADVMADVLRLEGHDVRVSYGGSHALHVANEFVPQIVIVDITMPELDGFEIATLIRDQSAAKKAVFVAHTASDRAAVAMRTDAVFHFHVLRPATPAEFAPAIEFARKLEPERRERFPGTLGDVLYSKRRCSYWKQSGLGSFNQSPPAIMPHCTRCSNAPTARYLRCSRVFWPAAKPPTN